MNVKSLLLGSAAASMLAATGAQAADPIVYVEPEPMEYVRICDVYGAGFFYIPGTETCLQISGFVRTEYRGNTGDFEYGEYDFDSEEPGTVLDEGQSYEEIADGIFVVVGTPDGEGTDTPAGTIVVGTPSGTEFDGDDTPNFHGQARGGTFNYNNRARINFDARTETELGTLRSFIRLQADSGNSFQSDVGVGIDQAYIQLGGLLMGYTESLWARHGGFSDTGMSYGYQQRQQVRYTFAANGFSGSVSLEGYDDMDYMPDVVAGLSYTQGWGSVIGTVAYDDSVETLSGAFVDSFSAALSGTVNFGAGSVRLSGFYSEEPGTEYGAIMFDDSAAEWSVLAAYQHKLTSTLTGIIEYQYFDSHFADTHQHAVLGSLVWFPVNQFEVRTELAWTQAEVDGDSLDDTFSGFLRFQRNF